MCGSPFGRVGEPFGSGCGAGPRCGGVEDGGDGRVVKRFEFVVVSDGWIKGGVYRMEVSCSKARACVVSVRSATIVVVSITFR